MTTTYDAFISYSHGKDKPIAQALQSVMQTLGKPWYKRRSLRVFRDDTSLTATPHLWPSIEQALSQSRFLILLASREAATSPWVAKEISYWLEHNSTDTLLIALTDGSLAWSNSQGDFGWSEATPIPPSLKRRFPNEPKWVDIREFRDAVSPRDHTFMDRAADFAAMIQGVPKEDLMSQEVLQHQRVMSLVKAVVCGLTLLTAAASVAAFFAFKYANQAENRRQIALSRQLAAEAHNQLGQSLDRALLLAVEATRVYETVEATGSLIEALETNPYPPTIVTPIDNQEGQLKRRISHAAFAPKSGKLVTTNFVGELFLLDAKTGEVVTPRLHAHSGMVTGLAFSPDGNLLATSSSAGEVQVHELATGKYLNIPIEKGGTRVMDVAFNPTDASLFVGKEDGTVAVATAGSPRLANLGLTGGNPLGRLATSLDGRYLAASANPGGAIIVWDLSTKQRKDAVLKGFDETVSRITFDPNGEILAVGGTKGGVSLWNIQTGKTFGPFSRHGGPVTALAVSPDGRQFASGATDGKIILWDSRDGAFVASLDALGESVSGLSFSADGRKLVSIGLDGKLVTWDLTSSSSTLDAKQGKVLALAFGTRDGTISSLGSDGTLAQWDATSNLIQRKFIMEARNGIFSPDGAVLAEFVAIDNASGAIQIYDTPTLSAIGGPFGRLDRGVNRIAMSRHRDKLAVSALKLDGPIGDQRTVDRSRTTTSSNIHVWQLKDDEPAGEAVKIEGHEFLCITLSPDGNVLAAGATDGTVTLYDTTSGKSLSSPLMGHDGWVATIAISDDGRLLATTATDSRVVYLWNIADAKHPKLKTELTDAGGISALAFQPNGKILVAGKTDGSIELWDVSVRKRIGQPLRIHSGGVSHLAFSSDGEKLVSAGHDNLIVVRDITLKSWRDRACRIANRNLTQPEWAQFLPDESPRKICSFGEVDRDNAQWESMRPTGVANDRAIWLGLAQYPGARRLCTQHVLSVNGEEIDWLSFATTDDQARVVAFYTNEETAPVEKSGGVTILRRKDDRVLSVHAAPSGDYPKCGEQPVLLEKTVIIIAHKYHH